MIIPDIGQFNEAEDEKHFRHISSQKEEYLKFRNFVYERQAKQQEALRRDQEGCRVTAQNSHSATKNAPNFQDRGNTSDRKAEQPADKSEKLTMQQEMLKTAAALIGKKRSF